MLFLFMQVSRFSQIKGSLFGAGFLLLTLLGVSSGSPAPFFCGWLCMVGVVLFLTGMELRQSRETHFRKAAKITICAILTLLMLFCGAHAYQSVGKVGAALAPYDGQTVFLTVRMRRAHHTGGYPNYYGDLLTINGTAVRGGVSVEAQSDFEPMEGDVIAATAKLSLPQLEETGFPTQWYLRSKGVFLCARIEDFQLIESGNAEEPLLTPLRESIEIALQETCEEEAGLAQGLLLGDKRNLSEEVRRDFLRAGAAHLLAVSGLHVGIWLCGLHWILRRLHCPKYIGFGVRVLFLLFFAALIGWSASVTRTMAMLFCAECAQLCFRKVRPIPTLLLSAGFFLCISPTTIYDVSFLLSVTSVFGILFGISPFTAWLMRKKQPHILRIGCKWVLLPVLTALAATLFSLPVAVLWFGNVSKFGWLSSLVLIPLATLCLLLCVPTLLCGCVIPPAVAGIPLRFCLRLLRAFAFAISGLPAPTVYLGTSAVIGGVAVGIGICMCVRLLFLHNRLLPVLSLPLLAAIVCGCVWTMPPQPSYTALLHSGDSDLVLIADETDTVLVDISDGSDTLKSETNRLLTALWHRQELQTYVMTQYGERGAELFCALCRAVRIRQLYLPIASNPNEQKVQIQILEEAAMRGVKTELYRTDVQTDLLTGAIRLNFCRQVRLTAESAAPAVAFTVTTRTERIFYVGGGTLQNGVGQTYYEQEIRQCGILMLGNATEKRGAYHQYRSAVRAKVVLCADTIPYASALPKVPALLAAPSAVFVLGESKITA